MKEKTPLYFNMKFGTIGPTYPPAKELLERPKANEEVGYDSIWYPDHLMGWAPQSIWIPEITSIANMMPSPHMFWDSMISLAMAGVSTSEMKIGTSVTESVRRHPAMIAQSILTVDHISEGRAVLGIGAGEGENITPYGLDFSKPVSRLEEALELIRLCWESPIGETFDYDGEFWEFKDAVFDTPLYDGEEPPIYIGGMGDRMCKLTAKYADGWIPPSIPPEDYKDRANLIDEFLEKEGRDQDELTKGLFVSVIAEEDEEACQEIMENPIVKAGCLEMPSSSFEKYGVEHPLGEDAHGLLHYIPSRLSKEEVLNAIEKVPEEVVRERYIYGSSDDIIDSIEKYQSLGMEHIVLWNETFLADFDKVGSSYKVIKRVMDYFNEQ